MIQLVVFVIALVTHATAQHNSNQPQAQSIVVNEDIYRQFQEWQQSSQELGEPEAIESQPQPNSVSQYNNEYNNYGGDSNQYGGNPWVKPTPAPTSPPYVDPNPNPGNQYHQNQNGGYYVPSSPKPPTHGGGYYPAPKPPQTGGYYPPATSPPYFPTQTHTPPPYHPPATQTPPPYYPTHTHTPPPYYPPVTHAPPTSGGYYPPHPATSPPVDPAVAGLRKHCLKSRGQFATHYCNKYVNCWDDTVIEQECPTGLMFSKKGFCDHDYNVDCHGRPIHHHVVPTMPSGHKHCSTAFGVYKSQTNCSEFIVCNHGVPITFCCPPGLHYNAQLQVCDYPYRAHCVNPKPLYTPEPELPPPSPIHNNPYYLQRLPADFLHERQSCVPNAIYRLEADCSSIAICTSAGKKQVINCGLDTAYNINSNTCVAKHLALC